MHRMDDNETQGEKKLEDPDACCFEQLLEAIPHYTTTNLSSHSQTK